MIEIAGYASSTGTKALNQKSSDERATVVAQYLRNTANVPMRRILAPAGYGATHPAASNSDAQPCHQPPCGREGSGQRGSGSRYLNYTR